MTRPTTHTHYIQEKEKTPPDREEAACWGSEVAPPCRLEGAISLPFGLEVVVVAVVAVVVLLLLPLFILYQNTPCRQRCVSCPTISTHRHTQIRRHPPTYHRHSAKMPTAATITPSAATIVRLPPVRYVPPPGPLPPRKKELRVYRSVSSTISRIFASSSSSSSSSSDDDGDDQDDRVDHAPSFVQSSSAAVTTGGAGSSRHTTAATTNNTSTTTSGPAASTAVETMSGAAAAAAATVTHAIPMVSPGHRVDPVGSVTAEEDDDEQMSLIPLVELPPTLAPPRARYLPPFQSPTPSPVHTTHSPCTLFRAPPPPTRLHVACCETVLWELQSIVARAWTQQLLGLSTVAAIGTTTPPTSTRMKRTRNHGHDDDDNVHVNDNNDVKTKCTTTTSYNNNIKDHDETPPTAGYIGGVWNPLTKGIYPWSDCLLIVSQLVLALLSTPPLNTTTPHTKPQKNYGWNVYFTAMKPARCWTKWMPVACAWLAGSSSRTRRR